MARHKRLPPNPGWAIYLRTSNEESQNPKLSQERQRFAIQTTLLAHSELPIITEYSDLESGRTPNRRNYQQMLEDARAGLFSYVAVERPDRFGRNDTEALRAMDELNEIGIGVRFASNPDLDPMDADDRILVTLSFTLARRESMLLGARVKGGLLAKLRGGGCVTTAPDGYLNMEERTSKEDKLIAGRHRHWVEPDPQQSKVWRTAWDLLLQDRLTLEQICEELHSRGYRYRSGRPFIEIKNGKRIAATNTLSKRFHNWFYAGWVVSETFGIPPKTIRGVWQPLVTTEEFETGLDILTKRVEHRTSKRKHEYLLKGLVYLEDDRNSTLIRLTGSTPNARRPKGGTSYYCQYSSDINISCALIDNQVAEALFRIQVDENLMPSIRETYTSELAAKLGHLRPDEREEITRTIKSIDEEETRMARQLAAGRISDKTWEVLWIEWQDRRRTLRKTLDVLDARKSTHIANLDAALTLIRKVGILFSKLERSQQRELLREIVERVVVNREGKLIRLELLPPFAYINDVSKRVTKGNVGKTKMSRKMAHQCSDKVSNSVPGEIRTPGPLLRRQMLYPLSYRHMMRILYHHRPTGSRFSLIDIP